MPRVELGHFTYSSVCCFRVWGEHISGIDVGDEAAAWMEKFLNKPSGTYRLVYHSEQLGRRVLVKSKDTWAQQCKPQDQVGRQSLTLIMVCLCTPHIQILSLHFTLSGTLSEKTSASCHILVFEIDAHGYLCGNVRNKAFKYKMRYLDDEGQ